jgi:hypothetical protein
VTEWLASLTAGFLRRFQALTAERLRRVRLMAERTEALRLGLMVFLSSANPQKCVIASAAVRHLTRARPIEKRLNAFRQVLMLLRHVLDRRKSL